MKVDKEGVDNKVERKAMTTVIKKKAVHSDIDNIWKRG